MFRFRNSRSTKSRRRGVAVVEFALVAPVMFLFLFGIIEFSRMMMVKQSMTNAAREGSRKAVLLTTTNWSDVDFTVRDYLRRVVPDSFDVDKVRVNEAPAGYEDIASGTLITVDVETNYSDVSWLPGSFLGLAIDPIIGARSTRERE